MSILLKLIGVLIFLAGIVGGFYVGQYLGFYEGILHLIDAVQATPIVSADVAGNIVRIWCSSICGVCTFYFCVMIAATFFLVSDHAN